MRRIISSPIVILSTLLVGTTIVIYHRRSSTPTSLCIVARNPDKYNGTTVRIRASASVVSSELTSAYLTIYDSRCAPDDQAGAVVELSQSDKLRPEVDAFVNNPKHEIRNADVVVSGVFDKSATPGCFTPSFGLHNAEITWVSQVKAEPLPPRESRVVK